MATVLRATRLTMSTALKVISLSKTPYCPWTGRCAERAPWKKDANRGRCPSTPPWFRVSERKSREKERKLFVGARDEQTHYKSVTSYSDSQWAMFFLFWQLNQTFSKCLNHLFFMTGKAWACSLNWSNFWGKLRSVIRQSAEMANTIQTSCPTAQSCTKRNRIYFIWQSTFNGQMVCRKQCCYEFVFQQE